MDIVTYNAKAYMLYLVILFHVNILNCGITHNSFQNHHYQLAYIRQMGTINIFMEFS